MLHWRKRPVAAAPVASVEPPGATVDVPPTDSIGPPVWASAPGVISTSAEAVVPAPGESPTLTAPGQGEKTSRPADKYEVLRELRDWAAKDPAAALAGVMKLPAGAERNEALGAVCSGLAESDPASAVKLAHSLGLDTQPGAVMANLVQQWASADVASALDWADQQPAGAGRDELTTRVAFVLSQTDPADAATLVTKQISSGAGQDDALIMVLHQWAEQDLSGATAWMANLPDTPLRERALQELEGIAQYRKELAAQ